jgi:hypothetical protein
LNNSSQFFQFEGNFLSDSVFEYNHNYWNVKMMKMLFGTL